MLIESKVLREAIKKVRLIDCEDPNREVQKIITECEKWQSIWTMKEEPDEIDLEKFRKIMRSGQLVLHSEEGEES